MASGGGGDRGGKGDKGGKSKGGWTDPGAGGGTAGGAGGGFHSPFAGLGALKGRLPEGTPAAAQTPAGGGTSAGGTSPADAAAPKGPARAVVRMERKGRGGKEVTVVEGLGLPAAQLEAWLKALKGALGCGGAVEGDALLLQGDQRERLPALLTQRGVRKVSVG